MQEANLLAISANRQDKARGSSHADAVFRAPASTIAACDLAISWQLRSRALELGERTLIMGVVNVTPDSFSDGGSFLAPGKGGRACSALAG